MEKFKCNGMCENCNMGDECGYNDCETEPDFMNILFKAVGLMGFGIVLLAVFLAGC